MDVINCDPVLKKVCSSQVIDENFCGARKNIYPNVPRN
jgi:hypothetical protein